MDFEDSFIPTGPSYELLSLPDKSHPFHNKGLTSTFTAQWDKYNVECIIATYNNIVNITLTDTGACVSHYMITYPFDKVKSPSDISIKSLQGPSYTQYTTLASILGEKLYPVGRPILLSLSLRSTLSIPSTTEEDGQQEWVDSMEYLPQISIIVDAIMKHVQ